MEMSLFGDLVRMSLSYPWRFGGLVVEPDGGALEPQQLDGRRLEDDPNGRSA